MANHPGVSRRKFLQYLGMSTISGLSWTAPGLAQQSPLITRPVPSSGEKIPVIGLGSWLTFGVGFDLEEKDKRVEIMRNFFNSGGRLIDCSPMYGTAQDVIGYGLSKLNAHKQVFSAEKVWVADGKEGPRQIERSRKLWGVQKFDLMQVHNILSWEEHLPTLYEMKTRGLIRYVGITTSHGRRHALFEKIMTSQPLDFIQVTYNMQDREVEERILPLAREKGIAVIINRPFSGGSLIRGVMKHPLPGWAHEIDCDNWAQFLLKFNITHPAVTCAIPATSRVDHVIQNMGAATGRLPDQGLRKRMISYVENL